MSICTTFQRRWHTLFNNSDTLCSTTVTHYCWTVPTGRAVGCPPGQLTAASQSDAFANGRILDGGTTLIREIFKCVLAVSCPPRQLAAASESDLKANVKEEYKPEARLRID